MKRMIVAIVLSLMACVALALPKPSQIEDALAAQHYAEARGMVAEVLREKPESARAHLLSAYLLAHVDRNRQAANAELQSATGLDKRGDVKSSPLFGRVVAEIDMLPSARAADAAAPPQAPIHTSTTAKNWSTVAWLLVLIAACLAMLYIMVRPKRGIIAIAYETPAAPPHTWASFGGSPSPDRAMPQPVYAREQYAAAAVQPGSAMGAFGMAASVAGGVVAGNMISDALHHRRDDTEITRSRRAQDEDDERRRRDSSSSTYSDPSPVSTAAERSSFSSSSSGSDSWSSSSSYSSSDSGSSSSSFDSGSSSSSDW
jgi:uncharacterized membrane protein YgcG